MENLARKLSSTPAHDVGTLARVDGAELVVQTGAGLVRARGAPSCLVAPEPGDLVLVAALEAGAAFVVAVLERDAAGPLTLTAEGGLAVRVPSGAFTVAAQRGVTIEAEGELAVTAASLEIDAAEARVAAGALSVTAALVRSEIDRVKHVAKAVETVADRIVERVKRAYRNVEEIEQVRAERIDYEAKTTLSLHGENTLLTADELVKIDGDQIHLG
ncbi:MAG TPA: DUF3540 domain-containing protein [Minicystis sp.]|nr:DUF3540 domain-containing protein [Minicystis sp.]